MSKKRLAATVVVLAIMVILNLLIARYYHIPVENKKIELKLDVLSDQGNTFELFYQEEGDAEFHPEKAVQWEYQTPGQVQEITFQLPAAATYVRLDFGMKAAESTVSNVALKYSRYERTLQKDVLLDTIRENDIAGVTSGDDSADGKAANGFRVDAKAGDPYLVWDTAGWELRSVVSGGSATLELVFKILMCVCIDLIFFVALAKAKELKSLPMELIHNRRLMFSLAKNDFKTKYAGSYLGIFWAFVQPIVTVLLYWFVFEKGLKAGGINTRAGITVPFVLWLVAGLVPWFFFQDVLNGATNALIEYNYLVKKVVFKISILPIIKMISALFVHGFFVVFMLILYTAMGYIPQPSWIQIIYYTVCTFMLTLGISYATCAIVIFFRDLSQIINIVLQVGTWMTPIMWNIQSVELHPILAGILKANPMYYVVEGYRQALITNEWVWDNPGGTIYFWIVVAGCFGIGSYVFKKLRVHFADVL